MKKIIIVLAVFFFDRATKIYLINLQSTGTEVDYYIFPFLNFFLIWNTGIGFGIASFESNIFYHILNRFSSTFKKWCNKRNPTIVQVW